MNLDHLDALQAGLARERERLAKARTAHERALRTVWVAQREREIAAEMTLLGIDPAPPCDMTDDELSAALGI